LCVDAIISKLKERLGKNAKHIKANFGGSPFFRREGISCNLRGPHRWSPCL
jgi:hypothetical protein